MREEKEDERCVEDLQSACHPFFRKSITISKKVFERNNFSEKEEREEKRGEREEVGSFEEKNTKERKKRKLRMNVRGTKIIQI